jgi:predicted alpha/beta-hydrolase family hydrolase
LQPGTREFALDGRLDALWLVPEDPVALIVLAHGAGAGLRHKNMESIAGELAAHGLASLRFNFPFMQAGKNRVDAKDVATDTIRLAADEAAHASELPLFLAGHSFGGRMASHAVADGVTSCLGLIFCSFPLHGAKKPDDKRAAHLADIEQPMLFLSGTRDDLADRDRLASVVETLRRSNNKTRVHWLDTANHSYVILKRTRTNPLSVFAEIGEQARRFVDEVTATD